ncbi:ABC transporter substrate-binding protein [Haloarchaeobius iranensis]|uniref:Peptide/nickel transport system substrate-binding protein n=1 Tax=Haloarchaeobius iranensis TaxID=996166 RepID=A0A1G9XE59_9EURY|nr:ABC transporter substrate-binding protein [Haloarchaeobius iranensis]SDM95040.1 peptide/nickel transport system substrate-binding protein [Haloarchaeobius iranensis]
MARDMDRRNFLKAAGAATATTTMTAGCVGDFVGSGGSGTLTYGRGAPSATLDPQASTSGEVAKVTNQVYDKLMGFEPGGSALVESLATDFTIEGTTATIQLREDATFHNGDEFTAEDFIATYRRFVDPEYEYHFEDRSGYGPYLLGAVEDVSAPDDYTVEFSIAKKYAPFLANLGAFAMAVLPKSEIESGTDFSSEMIGTSAFQFESADQGTGTIRLSAYDDYYGEGPHVEEVTFEVIGENGTRASSLNAGELDIIDGLSPQTITQVEDGEGEIKRRGGINVGYLAMNMATFEPFRNKKVRQAMNYAIDTEELASTVYQGIATPASQPIPDLVTGYNEELDPYPYDPDQAQTLLEEAGYGDGFEFELATFQNPRAYNPSPGEAAETVRSYLGEVGITANLEQKTWETYLNYTAQGSHDACFLGWMTDNGDPDNFYYALLHPQVESDPDQDYVEWSTEGINKTNRAAWANNEFMELVEQGQSTYETSERQSLYREAGAIFHEECPWVPLVHTEEVRGIGPDVSNFTVGVIGGPFLNRVELE